MISDAGLAELLAQVNDTDYGKFAPWALPDGRSPQREFLAAAATHLTRCFRCGNQIGKTLCGCFDVLAMCLGLHPFSRFKPPVRWWVSGLDWELGIGTVIWPKMRPMVPMGQVDHITWMRSKEPQIPLFIQFKNGSSIRFKTAEAGRAKYQGDTVHGVWMDEEHPPDIVEECKLRLAHFGGYLNLTLTPVAGRRYVQDLERDPRTKIIRASMLEAAEAGILDKDFVANLERTLPERQRRVRIFGDFMALEGSVFPEFSRQTHLAQVKGGQLVCQGKVIAPWPLPEAWPRFAAIDWGFTNPCAVVLAAEDPVTGRVIVTRCYYASQIRASVWARLLRENNRLPKLAMPIIADHDADSRAEFTAQGIPNTPAEKAIEYGLEVAHRYVAGPCKDGAPKLVLVEDRANDVVLGRCDADKLAWEMEMYHYPATKEDKPNVKELPVDKDNHALDAIRYLLVFLERRANQRMPYIPEKAPDSPARQALSAQSFGGRIFGR